MAVADRGMYAVGTNNNTDFLRPVDVADVEVLAEPVSGLALALRTAAP